MSRPGRNHPGLHDPAGSADAEPQPPGPDRRVADRRASSNRARQETLHAPDNQDVLARSTHETLMSELAASIAHELQQPLTAIATNARASSRFLESDVADLQQVEAALRDIDADARRASDIVARIRNLFRPRDVARTPLGIRRVIADVARSFDQTARANGVVVSIDTPDDLPEITGDQVQLEQVVKNLVTNALQAMEAVAGRPRILVIRAARQDEGTLLVSVSDSGAGIPAAERPLIFTAFHTTKADGMGLGLAISRSIVESHGGNLWAVRNDGPGETFHFTLPIANGNRAP
jgi:signal transduction histidine kinase